MNKLYSFSSIMLTKVLKSRNHSYMSNSFVNFIFTRNFSSSKIDIIKNDQIKFPELRVVYKNEDGKDEHKIMKRLEALNLAKSRSLDLILISSEAKPPVCRIDDSQLKKKSIENKRKEIQTKEKSHTIKEIHIGCSIESHDLSTKLNKIREFLSNGHPVRVSFISNKKLLEKNPLAIDQIVLKVLEMIEKDASTVQPLPQKAQLRKDILINPKSNLTVKKSI